MVNFASLDQAYDIPSKQIQSQRGEIKKIRSIINEYENNPPAPSNDYSPNTGPIGQPRYPTDTQGPNNL